jgi:MerR family transcriptional regulator/heat shock protein HspR
MTALTNDETYYEPVYTIGHAAQKLGLAIPTLRMYEQAGLVLSYRTESNRRLYSRYDVWHIEQIINLIRKNGLNLEAIRRLAAVIPCWRIVKGPEIVCKNCRAYLDNLEPCWMIPETECKKFKKDCRSCDVYLSFPQRLQDLKSLYKNGFE